jgi:adenosylmethionine-8-amino-7-oxononanoate aminotransferase
VKDTEININQHLLHPWGDLSALGKDDWSSIVVRGEGVYVYDAEGNRLLDGPAGMWCMQTGYGRSEIADAVVETDNEFGLFHGVYVNQ